jgi:hypothetical protein
VAPQRSSRSGLLEKGWALASEGHSLGSLQGKSLGSHRLVVWLGTKNRFGARYFQVFLQDTSGGVSRRPVILGLFSQGRYPSYNWIEVISFRPQLSFESVGPALDITASGLTRQLFQYLADLIPPGGHLMVEYDSPAEQDTARALSLGIPPVATPLGYMMFLIGCGTGFKDWYFAESGSEGPRKLQGYKALNREQALLRVGEMVWELEAFLSRPASSPESEWERAARQRAREIISSHQSQTGD